MKTTLTTVLMFLVMTFGTSVHASPSAWSGTPTGKFWKNWAVAFNGGVTSYFGDLSIYDTDPGNKLKYESKPAVGFLVSKYFKDNIALSGQFIYGGLKSRYNQNLSFETKLVEYNAQLRVDLLNLILKTNNSGIGVIAFGGIGHMIFNSVKHSYTKGEMNSSAHRARSPEFVYFMGGGIEYSISDRVSVNMDAGIRQAQNDRIDNEVRKGNNDFYSLINVGVTYHIFRLFGPTRKGNLTRPGVRMAGR